MTRLEATSRIAKRLVDEEGWEPKAALEEAKRIVAKHPTADQIRGMRVIRERRK
jgi:hypothetical protein